MDKSIPEIVFATNNAHKLEEARQILGTIFGGRLKVLSLSDIGCHDDIPETSDTLEGNALIKARWVKEKYGYDCFADDTGLLVKALHGAPGVYSARYAGPHCSPADNIELLLKNMKGETDREAKFCTVVALIFRGKEYLFEGEVEGVIAEENQGVAGFGYDPVFIPQGETLSFAEMSAADKNKISHRGRAMQKLARFFESGEAAASL